MAEITKLHRVRIGIELVSWLREIKTRLSLFESSRLCLLAGVSENPASCWWEEEEDAAVVLCMQCSEWETTYCFFPACFVVICRSAKEVLLMLFGWLRLEKRITKRKEKLGYVLFMLTTNPYYGWISNFMHIFNSWCPPFLRVMNRSWWFLGVKGTLFFSFFSWYVFMRQERERRIASCRKLYATK